MHSSTNDARGPTRRFIDGVEEGLIALILAAMTFITFANVVARYVFNSNILWALEATVLLFAWMVLLGASYLVKITAHLGVDVVINALPPAWKRPLALVAVLACAAYATLLLIGGWAYWSRFGLEAVATESFPYFGFAPGRAAFLETNDIPMPGFLQFLAASMNEGELYEKMPRYIPYVVLPISAALLLLRFVQAGWRILMGAQDSIIASHEAEDAVEEAAAAVEAGAQASTPASTERRR